MEAVDACSDFHEKTLARVFVTKRERVQIWIMPCLTNTRVAGFVRNAFKTIVIQERLASWDVSREERNLVSAMNLPTSCELAIVLSPAQD